MSLTDTFDNPQSRVEAILQNAMGAEHEVVPQSRVEELLERLDDYLENIEGKITDQDEEIIAAVNAWLEDNPEATTTVQDGAITAQKLNSGFLEEVKNGYVTPQMYGAKGDGVTDDTQAIQDAVDNADIVFLPRGEYITSDSIVLTSGKTLFGTGRESKIINTVHTGFGKTVLKIGALGVGSETGSFLELPTTPCTVNSDRYSIAISDTSDYAVGDIVYICRDESWSGTKNPPYSWTGKIQSIVDGESITLRTFIDNDFIINTNCIVRNLSHTNSVKAGSAIYEDVCVHDLSLVQQIDDGSGMYVIEPTVYNSNFYNLWCKGNTVLGSNYCVDTTFENITAEFDGGFCDIPEINQFVILRNCRGKRYGMRGSNQIGITFLMGYKALVENCFFDMGDKGKVSFEQHIKAIVRNNTFINLRSSSGGFVLSTFGNCIAVGNYIASRMNGSIVVIHGTGNVVKNNYIDNPNGNRWLGGFTTISYVENDVRNNNASLTDPSDAYSLELIDAKIHSARPFIKYINSTTNVASGSELNMINNANLSDNLKLLKITLLVTSNSYFQLRGTYQDNGSDVVKTHTFANVSKLEMYVSRVTNYVQFVKNGAETSRESSASSGRYILKELDLINNSENAIQVYMLLIEQIA